MWCHLSTIFNQRYALRLAGVLTLCVALITTLFFGVVVHAAPGGNKTLSYQGRLSYANGGAVADGHYNIQFKIYEGGAGAAANNPGGSLEWEEAYVNNGGTGGVDVKGGYFSVNLGSINPFGNNVNWDDDTLWISMNVAGSSVSCTSFGTAPCGGDGEMLPMKRITATPYALNAGQLGGKTADNFVQLAQGVQTDVSSNTSSIHINKTGSGNLIQLQNTGDDAFTITNNGDVTLGNNSDKTISVATADENATGNHLTISAGNGGDGNGANGGDLVLQGGNAGGANGSGGVVVIDSGHGAGGGGAGTIYIGTANDAGIQIGNTNLGGGTQTIVIGTNENSGGTTNVVVGSGSGAGSGDTRLQAKDSIAITTDGIDRATFTNANTVYFGNGVAASAPDNFTLQGTNSTTSDVAGGTLTVQGGNATTGDADGGNVVISGGTASGAGVNGLVVITTPTFSTVTNDDNCYTGGSLVSSSCNIAASTVNNSAAAVIGFDTTGQTASMPDPALTTPGRIFYVMGAGGSEAFTLSLNSSDTYDMQANTAMTLIWNGSDWLVAGASGSVAPQNFMMMQEGGGELMMSGFAEDNGGETAASTSPETEGNSERSAPTPTTDGSNYATLQSNATTPSDAPLGSMYYDTTLGKVQCYEAEGWGACGASPDTFVTISPEYTNAVMNGADIGTISSDLCSDSLNINDGSTNQPTICGEKETYNFYKWTSAEQNAQTRSIFVTYELPATFKEFVAGSTSLMGRTDNTDSKVTYQVYRDSKDDGLIACGESPVSVATGPQTTWQKATATNDADPSTCGFKPGDSLLLRINLSASKNANAYVSNLGFAFGNN